MFVKFTIFCSSIFIIQTISGQAIGHGLYANNYANAVAAEAAYANNLGPLGYGPLAAEAAMANNLAFGPLATEAIPEIGRSFNGGGLKVTSYSAIAPTGVTVESENLVFEGPLAVTGQLPFAGVVALEGPLPATGQGAVSYACGDGNVGIVKEGIENLAPAYPNVARAGVPEFGFNGLARNGPIY